MTTSPPPRSVRLREISPRLAFQAHTVSTDLKVEFVRQLAAAGLRDVELSSFVGPDRVPGPAAAAGADSATFLLSVDEEFARANTGRSTAGSLDEPARLRGIGDGLGIAVSTYPIFVWDGPTGAARTRPGVATPGSRPRPVT